MDRPDLSRVGLLYANKELLVPGYALEELEKVVWVPKQPAIGDQRRVDDSESHFKFDGGQIDDFWSSENMKFDP